MAGSHFAFLIDHPVAGQAGLRRRRPHGEPDRAAGIQAADTFGDLPVGHDFPGGNRPDHGVNFLKKPAVAAFRRTYLGRLFQTVLLPIHKEFPMAILNFGSLNIDFVYAVDHIVLPGETIASRSLEVHCGGKGLNQSIALARAGAEVYHAGMVGPDGEMLLAACRENGVDVRHVKQVPERCGNAIIQVARDGQNSIVLFGGANRQNDSAHIGRVLAGFKAGDTVLLQNEINGMAEIIDQAHAKGLEVALNPSPFHESILAWDLKKISLFIMNEVEGWQLTGEKSPEGILTAAAKRFPHAEVVLTLGGDGAWHQGPAGRTFQEVYPAKVVDTTAAGDTFTGYYLAARQEGQTVAGSLDLAARAAAVAVSRHGAVTSIPRRAEVAPQR